MPFTLPLCKMRVIAYLLLFSSSICYAQTENYDQTLTDLVMSKNWFKAELYYQQHKDSIQNEFVKLLYQAEMGKVFNRMPESTVAYEQLIEKNFLNMDNGLLISLFYTPLLQCYTVINESEKGLNVCDRLINIFKTDTSATLGDKANRLKNITALKDLKLHLRQTKKIEKTRLAGSTEIPLLKGINGLNYLIFQAEWNGMPQRTLFDTGASYCYIWNRAVAEKIGVKLNEKDTINMNNGALRTLLGMIDSLKFGNFTFKNIPVYVSIESIDQNDLKQVKCDSTLNSMFDIVLGTSIISKLGVVELDLIKRSLSFPAPTEPTTNSPKNIYFENGMTYLNMRVVGKDFASQFDTGGGDGLIINSTFYEQNRDLIVVEEITDSNKAQMVGGCNALSFIQREEYACKNIGIQIGDVQLDLKENCSISKNRENDYSFGTESGGALGNHIFNYARKARFDFDQMVFRIIIP